MVDGFHQADATHLKQIVRVFSPRRKLLHHTQHKPEIPADHALARLFVARARLFHEFPLLAFFQYRELCGVQPAELHFLISHIVPLPPFRMTEVWGGSAANIRRETWE